MSEDIIALSQVFAYSELPHIIIALATTCKTWQYISTTIFPRGMDSLPVPSCIYWPADTCERFLAARRPGDPINYRTAMDYLYSSVMSETMDKSIEDLLTDALLDLYEDPLDGIWDLVGRAKSKDECYSLSNILTRATKITYPVRKYCVMLPSGVVDISTIYIPESRRINGFRYSGLLPADRIWCRFEHPDMTAGMVFPPWILVDKMKINLPYLKLLTKSGMSEIQKNFHVLENIRHFMLAFVCSIAYGPLPEALDSLANWYRNYVKKHHLTCFRNPLITTVTLNVLEEQSEPVQKEAARIFPAYSPADEHPRLF